MAGQNITAADAIIELVIAELYPSGFNLEQFEAQNIFEMGDTDMAEYQRTADGKLLGGLIQGSDELMAPGMDTVFADGALQWPLPVAGTITSPQGYRTDPLTGKTSYHSGTWRLPTAPSLSPTPSTVGVEAMAITSKSTMAVD